MKYHQYSVTLNQTSYQFPVFFSLAEDLQQDLLSVKRITKIDFLNSILIKDL